MRSFLILALLLPVCGQRRPFPDPDVLGPYSAATNHSSDLMGTPDSRPDTWGNAGYAVHKIEFHPPAGYRVRILRVYGDFQGWVRKNPSGNCAGVLWGLSTTQPEGSQRVTPAADNTMLYVQDSVCAVERKFRAPVDYDTSAGGLLGPDNVLVSKVAVWLNETGEPVHVEPSFTVVYQFEREK